MKERHLFIDQLRALAIFFIIFGHNDYGSSLGFYLASFRLPLFFIISGLVGRGKEEMGLKDFLVKYSKRLLVPYFSISLLLFLFWFVVGRHFGDSVEAAYSPIKNFIGIFYAQGGPEYMNWGIPMWFLPALFMVMFIDYWVAKLPFAYRFIPAVLLPVAGVLLFKTLGFHLPWSIDVAMAVYGFYFFGGLLKRVDYIAFLDSWKKPLLIFLIFVVIHGLVVGYNTKVLFYYGQYGNFALMYLNGITGFMWAFALMKMLPTIPFMVWIGRNTLPLLAFHLLAMTFIKAIALYGFNYQLQYGLWNSLLYSTIQIGILVPVILFLNRYLPFMVGNPPRKKELSS